jgi:hypothetical protein
MMPDPLPMYPPKIEDAHMRVRIAVAMRNAVIGGLTLEHQYKRMIDDGETTRDVWETRADMLLIAFDRLGLKLVDRG